MTIPSKHFNVVSTFSFGSCDVTTWDNVNLKVDMNNVRQRQNNVVIFNVKFYNVGKHRNNVKMTASKNNKKN